MTIQPDDEEKLLLDKLLSARHAIELNKEAKRDLTSKGNMLEKQLADIEQAFIDYMTGNGIKATDIGKHSVTLGESETVEVPDVDALPDEFVRIKTTREPNKVLLKELRPQANYYTIQKNYKLTVKGI